MQLTYLKGKGSGCMSLSNESSILNSNHDPEIHGQFALSLPDRKGGIIHTLLLWQKLMPCLEREVDVTEDGICSYPRNVFFIKQPSE